ncbi:MAG: aminotransferase class V-fold PLP-dependent enzyme, partial [Firmicutes bacterium]|nr:aminotransferase class V-fold PLP-dependent enzyme [Bacillota bacterium]
MSYDWEAVRHEFPVAQEHVYLNHAQIGPLPQCVTARLREYVDDWCAHGRACYSKWEGETENTRQKVAKLIGASPDEIAFTGSTTSGVLLISHALGLRPGDNVLTADLEHPANVSAWLALSRSGVETRFVKSTQGRVLVSHVEAMMDEATRVVALSFVEFTNGYRNDLVTLGRLCRERGVHFFVDAIQGIGALRFDVGEYFVDSLSCGGYKWLLGPLGTAFVYVRRDLIKSMIPPGISWKHTMASNRLRDVVMRDSDSGEYDLTIPAFEHEYDRYQGAGDALLPYSARRFEEGMPNLPGMIGLGAALDLIQRIGVDRIEQRLCTLTDLLCDKLEAKGYVVLSSRSAGERSQIVSFGHETYTGAEPFEELG